MEDWIYDECDLPAPYQRVLIRYKLRGKICEMIGYYSIRNFTWRTQYGQRIKSKVVAWRPL